ncbi:DNA primase [Candidatus Saccharibacteria bacterium]|nr:DNA primase [Candidatus Saccharibacteria bacterium]MCL1962947.1 DNA primase [Candidatus Saccharibacteria bacterium]
MNDAKEEVRSKLAIEDVIGEYVQLKRSGRYWRGLSPFTHERTPSFFVTPDRDIWHDFSSNKGGDIFAFVMEIEGLDFRGALELLARKAGVDLALYNNNAPRDLTARKNRALEINQIATNYFMREMTRSQMAMEYIFKKRGLTKETVIEWGIGFAPNDSKLHTVLLGKKFSDHEIREAGLISARGGEMFRSRMTIPLRDSQGQIVGFTGRIIGDGEPKYLNTPGTILYDKGRQVFGLNFAKSAIRQEDFAVLVEGNLDVISSHQANVKNVVACAGTALTREHLKSLGRLTHNINLCFDGDRAGVVATERAIVLAESLDLKLSVISFDIAKDPDEIITKFGAEKWREIMKNSTLPAVEWVIKKYAGDADLSSVDGKKILTTKALNLIKNLRDAVEIEFYLKQLSNLTGASLSVLMQKMNLTTGNNVKQTRKILKPTKNVRREFSKRDEQFFLNQIFAFAFKHRAFRTILQNLPDTYLTETLAKIKYHLLGQKTEITPEMADKLAEIEIIASQLDAGDDARISMFGFMHDLEIVKLRHKFSSRAHELVNAIDANDTERIKLLNGAVNSLKKDLNLLEKTSARDDFAGLLAMWERRK